MAINKLKFEEEKTPKTHSFYRNVIIAEINVVLETLGRKKLNEEGINKVFQAEIDQVVEVKKGILKAELKAHLAEVFTDFNGWLKNLKGFVVRKATVSVLDSENLKHNLILMIKSWEWEGKDCVLAHACQEVYEEQKENIINYLKALDTQLLEHKTSQSEELIEQILEHYLVPYYKSLEKPTTPPLEAPITPAASSSTTSPKESDASLFASAIKSTQAEITDLQNEISAIETKLKDRNNFKANGDTLEWIGEGTENDLKDKKTASVANITRLEEKINVIQKIATENENLTVERVRNEISLSLLGYENFNTFEELKAEIQEKRELAKKSLAFQNDLIDLREDIAKILKLKAVGQVDRSNLTLPENWKSQLQLKPRVETKEEKDAKLVELAGVLGVSTKSTKNKTTDGLWAAVIKRAKEDKADREEGKTEENLTNQNDNEGGKSTELPNNSDFSNPIEALETLSKNLTNLETENELLKENLTKHTKLKEAFLRKYKLGDAGSQWEEHLIEQLTTLEQKIERLEAEGNYTEEEEIEQTTARPIIGDPFPGLGSSSGQPYSPVTGWAGSDEGETEDATKTGELGGEESSEISSEENKVIPEEVERKSKGKTIESEAKEEGSSEVESIKVIDDEKTKEEEITDYYDLPGIDGRRDLAVNGIKKALKKMFLQAHSDKTGKKEPTEAEKALFSLAESAQKILANEHQRNKYDWGLAKHEEGFFYLKPLEVKEGIPGSFDNRTTILHVPTHRNESPLKKKKLSDKEFIAENIKIVETEIRSFNFLYDFENIIKLAQTYWEDRGDEELSGKIASHERKKYTSEQLRNWRGLYANLKGGWLFKSSRKDIINLTDDLLSIIYQAGQQAKNQHISEELELDLSESENEEMGDSSSWSLGYPQYRGDSSIPAHASNQKTLSFKKVGMGLLGLTGAYNVYNGNAASWMFGTKHQTSSEVSCQPSLVNQGLMVYQGLDQHNRPIFSNQTHSIVGLGFLRDQATDFLLQFEKEFLNQKGKEYNITGDIDDYLKNSKFLEEENEFYEKKIREVQETNDNLRTDLSTEREKHSQTKTDLLEAQQKVQIAEKFGLTDWKNWENQTKSENLSSLLARPTQEELKKAERELTELKQKKEVKTEEVTQGWDEEMLFAAIPGNSINYQVEYTKLLDWIKKQFVYYKDEVLTTHRIENLRLKWKVMDKSDEIKDLKEIIEEQKIAIKGRDEAISLLWETAFNSEIWQINSREEAIATFKRLTRPQSRFQKILNWVTEPWISSGSSQRNLSELKKKLAEQEVLITNTLSDLKNKEEKLTNATQIIKEKEQKIKELEKQPPIISIQTVNHTHTVTAPTTITKTDTDTKPTTLPAETTTYNQTLTETEWETSTISPSTQTITATSITTETYIKNITQPAETITQYETLTDTLTNTETHYQNLTKTITTPKIITETQKAETTTETETEISSTTLTETATEIETNTETKTATATEFNTITETTTETATETEMATITNTKTVPTTLTETETVSPSNLPLDWETKLKQILELEREIKNLKTTLTELEKQQDSRSSVSLDEYQQLLTDKENLDLTLTEKENKIKELNAKLENEGLTDNEKITEEQVRKIKELETKLTEQQQTADNRDAQWGRALGAGGLALLGIEYFQEKDKEKLKEKIKTHLGVENLDTLPNMNGKTLTQLIADSNAHAGCSGSVPCPNATHHADYQRINTKLSGKVSDSELQALLDAVPNCSHTDYNDLKTERDTLKTENDQLKEHKCDCDSKVMAKEKEIVDKIITDLSLSTERERENALDAIITEIKNKITPPSFTKDTIKTELDKLSDSDKSELMSETKPSVELVQKVSELTNELGAKVDRSKLEEAKTYQELIQAQNQMIKGKIEGIENEKKTATRMNWAFGTLSVASLLALAFMLYKMVKKGTDESLEVKK